MNQSVKFEKAGPNLTHQIHIMVTPDQKARLYRIATINNMYPAQLIRKILFEDNALEEYDGYDV